MAGNLEHDHSKLQQYSNGPQMRDFLRGQIFGTIQAITTNSISNPDNRDRTIIVTGANSGLGFEAVKQLIRLGIAKRLILACRNVEKGNQAKDLLLGMAECTKKQVQIDVWQLDMADVSSIKTFSARVEQELVEVDAVILNAGVDLTRYEMVNLGKQGYEMTLMVNVISTIMLAILPVPILRKNKPAGLCPRLTIVGSSVQFAAKYQIVVDAANADREGILSCLSDETRWNGKIMEGRYFLSKGLLQMLVRQLAKRIGDSTENGEKPDVIINCVNPGWCRTELFREDNTFGSRLGLRLIGWEAEVGARALIIGAVGVEGGRKSHGGYMSEGQVKQCCTWFETEQGIEISGRMWDEVCELVEATKPGAIAAV